MNNRGADYIKRLLKDKERFKKWKRIMLALSCVVVFITVYALTIPAVTLACDKEEHVHTTECYDENNELICTKEEHTHSEDCYEKEEQEPVEEEDEESPVVEDGSVTTSEESETSNETTNTETSNPYDLNTHSESIKNIKFTYKQGNVDTTVTTGGTVSNADSTDINVIVECNSIPVKTLKECGGQITYQLPDDFRIKSTDTQYITLEGSSEQIGTIHVDSNGKVTITYYENYLNGLSESATIEHAQFSVSTQIKLEKLNENGNKIITTPKGDITLNYGADYYGRYGNVEVKKTRSEEYNGEYIKYTIQLTAKEDGCKNLYVVDKFTENWNLIDYVGIDQNQTILTGKGDQKNPYEQINTSSPHGKIYLTNASDEKIPGMITENLGEHKSFVWSIDEMKANEERILTYYVKLKSDGGLINTKNNQEIKNQVNVYSRKDNGKIYDKGSDEAEFSPYISYNMAKDVLNNTKDDTGVYTITYKLSFTLDENSNYPLMNFIFWDSLAETDSNITSTNDVYYDENSIQLYKKENNKDQLVNKDNYQVLWAKQSGTDYSKNFSKDTVRFKVKGTAEQPIVMNPGDSYYVTYSVKVNPEVYAVMKKDSVDIKNVYYASSGNACDGEPWGMINQFHQKVTLNDFSWVNKALDENTVKTDTTISMKDGDRYVDLKKDNSDTEFKVNKGSYKYTVTLNKSLGLFDITSVTLQDTLSSSSNNVMKFVGYAKITAHDEKSNENKGIKWIKIEDKTSFNLNLSDIGWTDNTYSYTFEYYAQPLSLEDISTVDVTNTFTLKGNVIKGTKEFDITNVNANNTVHLEGSYHLDVNKRAWYYEKPQENAMYWKKGKLYWVIEVNGSRIKKDTEIIDRISSDANLEDHFLHQSLNAGDEDSIVGLYFGNEIPTDSKNIEEYKTKHSAEKITDYFDIQYVKGKFDGKTNEVAENDYGQLTFKAKKNIEFPESKKMYIIIQTSPCKLLSDLQMEYRDKKIYRNELYKKDPGEVEKNFGKVDQKLYKGGDILKELGQTFSYDGSTYKNLSKGKDTEGTESKIKTDLINSKGVYASWAFKLNLAGELKGNYRVLENIPEGMDLEYIRIKWVGTEAKNDITSPKITNINSSEWDEHINTSTGDDNVSRQTVYYVSKDKRQALIELDCLKDMHIEDQYSVDVQVVCRVTDPQVLLNGQSVKFTNRVTLLNENGTEKLDEASSDATISDQNLTKQNLSINGNKLTTGQKIKYEIIANSKGQSLLKNSNEKLILVDELGENLSFDSDSFSAINLKDNSVVDLNPKFDIIQNKVEIEIPDNIPIKINYTATLNARPGEPVTLNNKVYWKSYENDNVNVTNENVSYSISSSGSSGSSDHPVLKIKKTDLDDMNNKISGVKFSLSQCELKNGEIEYTTPQKTKDGLTTSEEGNVKVPLESYTMDFNTIYEVKETQAAPGYILDDQPFYIMCAKTNDSGNYEESVNNYIEFCKGKDPHRYKVVYNPSDFVLEVYNAQKGITVKKAFINNTAGNVTKPVSGTYTFGLYEDAQGNGERIQTQTIKYSAGEAQEKTAKFINLELDKTYYVFELDDKGNPIVNSSQEVTINKLQYTVEYKNEKGESTNAATNGQTVTVTNRSRTKILPSTGGYGSLLYRISGAMLALASLIYLINIYKKNHLDDTSKKRRKK